MVGGLACVPLRIEGMSDIGAFVISILQWVDIHPHRRPGYETVDLGERILRYEDEVSRPQMCMLPQAILLRHLLDIQYACFTHRVVLSPKQKALRLYGLLREPSRDLHCLRNGGVEMQFVLAGPD